MNLIANYQALAKTILDTRANITTERPDWYLPLWVRWYAGYDHGFHRYYTYNGQRHVYQDKKHLNMLKRVSEDWASILFGEGVKISVGKDENLQRLLKDVKFRVKVSRAIEIGFGISYAGVEVAISDLGFDKETQIISKSDRAKLKLNYYKATQSIPISFDGNDIFECAFVSEDSKTLSINAHIFDKEAGEWHILIYRKDKENGKDNVADFNTRSPYPLFAIFEPNIENNLLPDSRYPISICANCIDVLQALDNAYDTSNVELVNGKKRIFVSSEMNQKIMVQDWQGNKFAKTVSAFDDNDVSIYVVPPDKDSKNLVYSPNDPLRIESINAAIQNNLNILSYEVGLGSNYYRLDHGNVASTATEVISSNSDMFRNKKKHEHLLEASLITLVRALIYCNNKFTTNPVISETEDINILFDDSIIEDKKSEKENDKADLLNGTMTQVEYRMKWFGEDEETARKIVYENNGRIEMQNRAKHYYEAFMSGELPPKGFVNLVYTDEDCTAMGMTRDELIAFYEDKKASDREITLEDLETTGGYNPNLNPPKNQDDEINEDDINEEEEKDKEKSSKEE